MSKEFKNTGTGKLTALLIAFLCTNELLPQQAIIADEPPRKSSNEANDNPTKGPLSLETRPIASGIQSPRDDIDSSFSKVVDLRETDSNTPNPLFLSFLPKPGKFELKVKRGWVGLIPAKNDGWKMVDCVRVRHSNPKTERKGLLYSGDDSVIDFNDELDDTFTAYCNGNGTATIRFIKEATGNSAPLRCELRIVIQPDTTEIDEAIREAVPNAKVIVSELRGGSAVLRGRVPTSEGISVIMEIGRTYYSNVINQLEVASDVAESKQAVNNVVSKKNEVKSRTENEALEKLRRELRLQQPVDLNTSALDTNLRVLSDPHPPHDVNELKKLRKEVRSLREDVRRLADLIENRRAEASQGIEEKSASSVPLQMPTPNSSKPDKSPKFGSNVMLYFKATWCQPCQQMAPVVLKLQRQGFPIRIVDIDKESEMAKYFQVESLPCFVRIENGKEVAREVGATSEVDLLKFVQPVRAAQVEPKLMVITYSVADLINEGIDGRAANKSHSATTWLQLIDGITNSGQSDVWEINGGPCSIRAFEQNYSLIIRATQETHEQIADFLADLRTRQLRQISYRFRTAFHLDENDFTELKRTNEFDPLTGIARVDENMANVLVARFQHQDLGDSAVTSFSGRVVQIGSLQNAIANHSKPDVGTDQGIQLYIRGISIDHGKLIRLNIAANPRSLINELASNSVTIPDGGQILIDLTKHLRKDVSNVPIKGRTLILVQAANIYEENQTGLMEVPRQE